MLKTFLKIILGLTAILTLAFAVFWFSREADVTFAERESKVPHSEFSKFAIIDGLTIHYQEKGNGTPIVLIHGFSSSTYTWKDVFVPLSENYRVIAVDLKGFGFSDKPSGDYSRRTQAEIVSKFLNQIKIEKAWIAGNSMGGEVALNIALRHPEKVQGLILIDSAGVQAKGRTSLAPWYLQTPLLGSALTAFSLTSDKLIREGLEKSYFDDSKITEQHVETYYQPLTTRDGQAAVIQARKQFSLHPIENELSKIKAPSLLLWGKDDEIIPVEAGRKMKSLIKGSKLVVFERCGHMPQEELPYRALAEIVGFIGNNGPVN